MNAQSRLIEWNGGVWTMADLARHHGLDYNLLWQRLSVMEWPLDKALVPLKTGARRATSDERQLAQRIIQHVRTANGVLATARLFKIKPTYVSFTHHGTKKRTGRSFSPVWVIKQIIDIAAQQGIKPPVIPHTDYVVPPTSVLSGSPKA
jgi:hypothetical protein